MKVTPIQIFLPDTRGVAISRFGAGNAKIGFGVVTYSRIAGDPTRYTYEPMLVGGNRIGRADNPGGTCPGSTDECERICYAKRITGPVRAVYHTNASDDVPELPEHAALLRIHVSGDFNTVAYIRNWVHRLQQRPDVTAWAYTRSWRVPMLLIELEKLRTLPNVQLFASMDKSTVELPPAGWRRAWIDGDERAGHPIGSFAHHIDSTRLRTQNFATSTGAMTYVCPEETGRKADCVNCGYCFEGQRNDVTFLEH